MFSRKRKVAVFAPPIFNGVTLNISDKVKYLGAILDKKLLWKDHIENRVTKAHRVWAMCRRAIGSKWGLSPKMTHWLYISVVRPILTYAALVWWPAILKKCNIGKLQKVQRLCCLGISGSIRTTSTRAMETLLSIHPVDVQVKYEAALVKARLTVTGEWICKDHCTQHQEILENLQGFYTIDLGSDKISEKSIKANCKLSIPAREVWNNGSILEQTPGIHLFTDGSRIGGRTGAGCFCNNPPMERCFRLPDHNTVFQAEMVAITECVKFLNLNEFSQDAVIFSDNQAVIRAISVESVKSKTILRCKEEINNYSCRGSLNIMWIPGHSGIEGNVMADECAKRGSSLDSVNLDNPKPFEVTKMELRDWANNMHTEMWNNDNVGMITKVLWGDPEGNRTKELLKLNKPSLSIMMGILTGHSSLRAHLFKMGKSDSRVCRACKEEDETLEHYLCWCPAFAGCRTRFLQTDTIPSLECLRGIGLKTLLDYVRETQFFLLN